MTFNPNNPLVLGLEWLPAVASSQVLAGTGYASVERFTSSVSETVASVVPHFAQVVTPGWYVAEVYERGAEQCPALNTATYRPTSDYANTSPLGVGFWQNEAGSAAVGVLYQSIDEGGLNTADYLEATAADYAALYSCRVGSGTFPSGHRVAAVRIKLVVASYGAQVITVGITDGVTSWAFPTTSYYSQATLTFTLPSLNPLTGYQPWTAADVQAMAYSVAITVQHGSFNPNASRVLQLWVEVDHALDNRKAFGSAYANLRGWLPIPLVQSNGTAGWVKQASHDYTVSVRGVTDPLGAPLANASWTELSGPVACPHQGHHRVNWLLDTNGCQMVAGLDDRPLVAHAVLLTVGAGYSADSQPYALVLSARVDSTSTVQQEFSNATAGDYGRVRALVRRLSVTTADLTVQVHRRSDSAAMGGPVTMTAADWDVLPTYGGDDWKLLDLYLAAPATLAAAVQYYAEFTTLAGTATNDGWEVVFLSTDGLGSTATYGGSTDEASIDGIRVATWEVPLTVAQLPAAPAAFAAHLDVQTIPDDGTDCPLVADPLVRLTWTATTLGALFGHYQPERTEDSGTTWHPIAILTTEGVNEFWDTEAPWDGTEVQYRLMVARGDGTLSLPTTVPAVTVARGTACAGWSFGANEAPELHVAYNQWGPERTIEFVDADGFQPRTLYGRDRQVVLRPLERDGDRMTVELLVSAVQQPARQGRPVFVPLETIALATLSYVCVHDPWGHRYYCAVNLGTASQVETDGVHQYVATVELVEVATVPSVPDVAVP